MPPSSLAENPRMCWLIDRPVLRCVGKADEQQHQATNNYQLSAHGDSLNLPPADAITAFTSLSQAQETDSNATSWLTLPAFHQTDGLATCTLEADIAARRVNFQHGASAIQSAVRRQSLVPLVAFLLR